MASLPKSILQRLQDSPAGAVMTPKEFLHMGSRAAVDQAFSRLVKADLLIRVCRGMYALSVEGRVSKSARFVEAITQSMQEKCSDVIVQSAASAAKSLGLNQKVPEPDERLTSGRARTLQIGLRRITLIHAPRWMLSLGSSKAGEAIRALAFAGEAGCQRATESLDKHLKREDWNAIAAIRASLPSWMAKAIGHVLLSRDLRQGQSFA